MPDLSVIVCTFNRASILQGALDSLAHQSILPERYEIIVVDNGSTDETSATVDAFRREYPRHNVVLVRELQQGLGHARNTGIKYARGNHIAYMDDDATAHRDWLRCATEIFDQVRPTPMCVGGQILPDYKTPKPSWFKDVYETRSWGPVSRFLTRGESFSGSNMIWKKDVLEAFGGFNVNVGVRGNCLSLGEETALFDKIWNCVDDPIFFYSPGLIVYHLVPAWKIKVSYQWKRSFSWGQSWYLVNRPKSLSKRLVLLRELLLSLAKKGILAVKQVKKYPCYQNWLVERIGPIIGELGRIAACFGLNLSIKQG